MRGSFAGHLQSLLVWAGLLSGLNIQQGAAQEAAKHEEGGCTENGCTISLSNARLLHRHRRSCDLSLLARKAAVNLSQNKDMIVYGVWQWKDVWLTSTES